VMLDRLSLSPGQIDARPGENFAKALAAFQRQENLPPSGKIDRATWDTLTARVSEPPLVEYTIADDDVAGPFERRIPRKLEAKAHLRHLAYRRPGQLLAEQFHI